MEIAATKDEIKIELLPPSENAAQQHSYRVYLQVMDSKFLEEAHVDPLKWDGSSVMGCIIPYIQNNPLRQLICSSLYVAGANFL